MDAPLMGSGWGRHLSVLTDTWMPVGSLPTHGDSPGEKIHFPRYEKTGCVFSHNFLSFHFSAYLEIRKAHVVYFLKKKCCDKEGVLQ